MTRYGCAEAVSRTANHLRTRAWPNQPADVLGGPKAATDSCMRTILLSSRPLSAVGWLLAVSTLGLGSALAEDDLPPVVATFALAADGVELDRAALEAGSTRIDEAVERSGLYRALLPAWVAVKRAELEKGCGPMSCAVDRVEVARAMSAEKLLRSTVSKDGDRCVLRVELVDLERAIPELTRSASGPCTSRGLEAAADEALQAFLWGTPGTRRAPRPSKLISIDAGWVTLGCDAKRDECRYADDGIKRGYWAGHLRPRRVHVEGFEIDATEVTVEQYRACVIAGGCSADKMFMPYWQGGERANYAWPCTWNKPGRERHPVNCIRWDFAEAYCKWMDKRLPTEKEWARAARGDGGLRYPWGNEDYGSEKVANISDRSAKGRAPFTTDSYVDDHVATAPVGSYPAGASPFGALDMVGNVSEWTGGYFWKERRRVARGGGWMSTEDFARAFSRVGEEEDFRHPSVGFRCARDAQRPSPSAK